MMLCLGMLYACCTYDKMLSFPGYYPGLRTRNARCNVIARVVKAVWTLDLWKVTKCNATGKVSLRRIFHFRVGSSIEFYVWECTLPKANTRRTRNPAQLRCIHVFSRTMANGIEKSISLHIFGNWTSQSYQEKSKSRWYRLKWFIKKVETLVAHVWNGRVDKNVLRRGFTGTQVSSAHWRIDYS